MKHIFVVNPNAGKACAKRELKKLLCDFGAEYEIYTTKAPKDATSYVRKRCEDEPEAKLRFYACGGDGTIKEVAEGIYGHDNADMSAVPLGSGNDFVKYYGGAEKFLDLSKLKDAPSSYIDLIRVNDAFCINVCNFGFESYVAKVMDDVRHKKVIGGKNAYTTGIVKGLLCAMKNKADIYIDGREMLSGEYLLCSVANGRYVGGAYQCAPRSLNDDGLLEVCTAKVISRFSFVKLINVYKEGKHLDDPRFKKFMLYGRAKKVEVHSDREITIALDGELMNVRDFTCEVIPKAVRFAAIENN